MKNLMLTIVVVASTGCGHSPSRLGVLRDEVGISRSRVGASPRDVFERDYLPGTTTRVKTADVVGDGAPELLVEGTRGEGIEVRNQSGVLIKAVRTPDYLTDFGAVAAATGTGSVLVLYAYPNAAKTGTFTVFDRSLAATARWEEGPPPGRFASGEWARQPALFFLQKDTIVIRSASGTKLQDLPAPDGRMFRDIFVQPLGNGRTAIVVSGSGYTPYHMVCVYDGARLVFADVEMDHAYGVERDGGGPGFVVTTRENRWRYSFR